MKRLIKKLIPARLWDKYHLGLAFMAGARFGFPSEKMIVIGVTGTNGKTTTSNLIARILEEAGHRVGLTTTANFKIAEKEWLNDTKMTMLGRSHLQSLLARMVAAGCRYAIVETSSEGVKQSRHAAINYDVVVFTNLTPEHIESHGGFENYKKAKGQLFTHLTARRRKRIGGESIKKTAIANLADPHAEYFLGFKADRKFGFLVDRPGVKAHGSDLPRLERVTAKDVTLSPAGSTFTVAGTKFRLNLPGLFNVENAVAAITVGEALGVPFGVMALALEKVKGVPGRMEHIDLGQPFSVLVDYAPEPESFKKLYEVVRMMKPAGRVIHVLGSCGGGRDIARRPILGALAAENADIVIVTNEDPYDDDPMGIIKDVAEGAEQKGKIPGRDLFLILDRGEALAKAVSLAKPGDLVIATGKGSEQAICVAGGQKIPWDDRAKLREIISQRLNKS